MLSTATVTVASRSVDAGIGIFVRETVLCPHNPDRKRTPAVHIEPRDYQQAALDAWIDHGRQGSVVLPTGSGKT